MGMVTIGHWAGRKKTDAEGYFLGERSVPIFAVVLFAGFPLLASFQGKVRWTSGFQLRPASPVCLMPLSFTSLYAYPDRLAGLISAKV